MKPKTTEEIELNVLDGVPGFANVRYNWAGDAMVLARGDVGRSRTDEKWYCDASVVAERSIHRAKHARAGGVKTGTIQ